MGHNDNKSGNNSNEDDRTPTERETTLIDLDKAKLPLNYLYEKMKLVTAFSQNHLNEGVGFIGSAQQQMPNKTIIVYDLGLQKEAHNLVVMALLSCQRFIVANQTILKFAC